MSDDVVTGTDDRIIDTAFSAALSERKAEGRVREAARPLAGARRR